MNKYIYQYILYTKKHWQKLLKQSSLVMTCSIQAMTPLAILANPAHDFIQLADFGQIFGREKS